MGCRAAAVTPLGPTRLGGVPHLPMHPPTPSHHHTTLNPIPNAPAPPPPVCLLTSLRRSLPLRPSPGPLWPRALPARLPARLQPHGCPLTQAWFRAAMRQHRVTVGVKAQQALEQAKQDIHAQYQGQVADLQ